jgi:hypothetical protein
MVYVVEGLGFRVLRFKVQGAGCRAKDAGFGV